MLCISIKDILSVDEWLYILYTKTPYVL